MVARAEDRLARVRWVTGQTLMPGDLVALEESLLGDVQERLALCGPPLHGVGALRLSVRGEQLHAETLAVVLPTGELLAAPGNAAVSPLDLGATGRAQVAVFLHREADGPTEPFDAGEPRRLARLRLSADRHSATAERSLELAHMVKGVDGQWSLDEAFAPPLLRVGPSVPFLAGRLAALGDAARSFLIEELRSDLERGTLSGESLFAARRCVVATRTLLRLLENLKGELHVHPYALYDELCRFRVELGTYRELGESAPCPPYRHAAPGPLFSGLADEVLALLGRRPESKHPYLPFVVADGMARLAPLPAAVARAEEVYVVVQKQHVADPLPLERLKLGAPRRLPTIHERALRGVPFQRVTALPFPHPFGTETVLLRLGTGEEWDQVLRDAAVAFYVHGPLEGLRVFLYWRQAA